jgi:hypothetical protein
LSIGPAGHPPRLSFISIHLEAFDAAAPTFLSAQGGTGGFACPSQRGFRGCHADIPVGVASAARPDFHPHEWSECRPRRFKRPKPASSSARLPPRRIRSLRSSPAFFQGRPRNAEGSRLASSVQNSRSRRAPPTTKVSLVRSHPAHPVPTLRPYRENAGYNPRAPLPAASSRIFHKKTRTGSSVHRPQSRIPRALLVRTWASGASNPAPPRTADDQNPIRPARGSMIR